MKPRLYRGLTKDGKWVYGWYVKTDFAHYIVPAEYAVNWKVFVEVIPETVGQSTGKYWEGDIYKAEYRCSICYDNEPHILRGLIEYREEDGMWSFDYGHGSMYLYDEKLSLIKKLGTIHENPELLEE